MNIKPNVRKFWITLLFCLSLLCVLRLGGDTSQAADVRTHKEALHATSPAGSEELQADDGTAETALAGNNVIAVNRLTPSSYPATLQTIRLIFPQLNGLPNPVGSQISLIAFSGSPGSLQPAANPTLLVNQTVTIPAATSDTGFVDFPIQNGPTITSGDFYVGFKSPNPYGGVVLATDVTGVPRQRAFASVDNGLTFVGPLTYPNSAIPINFLIRAVVMNDSTVASRIGLPDSFDFGASEVGGTLQQNLIVNNVGNAPLTITSIVSDNGQFAVLPTTVPQTISPGEQLPFALTFKPANAGSQTATLTITSNDPARPSAKVTLTGVGATPVNSQTIYLNSNGALTGIVAAPPLNSGTLLSTQYAIFVPTGASQLKIDLNSNQDVDLYVRFNQRIALSGNSVQTDFGSASDGIVPESVTITPGTSPALQSGLYYIAIANFGPGIANYTLTATLSGNSSGKVAAVSSASYQGGGASAEEIVALFGSNLATGIAIADSVPLPTALLGSTVSVRDNTGTERQAPLFFVSSGQINALIPPDTAIGSAELVVTSGDGKVSAAAITISAVIPSLFTANADGQGVPAAAALRVKADGSSSYDPVSRFDATLNRAVSVPIDLGAASDQVFLVLNGTGIRGRSALSAVSATIGGVVAPVEYAGPQGVFVGLDQLNIGIPRTLIGRGEVDLILTVDGKAANTVRVNIK